MSNSRGKKNLILIVAGALMAGALIFFSRQNKLLRTQTHDQRLLIAQQAALIDSIKTSSMANLMPNVLDRIDEELKNNPKRILSDETIARIAALCYSFMPYPYTQGDTLSAKKLSPERGQLLLMLAAMKIDTGSIDKIMQQASFTGADLRDADLRGAHLSGINLSDADLSGCNLSGADLSHSDLSFANLWGANLSKANLSDADMKRTDLRWANLNEVNLKNADLQETDLASAQLRKADLSNAILRKAILTGAFLNEANLDSADMFTSILLRAQLTGAKLTNTNLAVANLVEANVTGADLTGANLSEAIVKEEDWLIQLNAWLVPGATEMQSKYKLVQEEVKGNSIYRLKKTEG